jgi:hypothetical protein
MRRFRAHQDSPTTKIKERSMQLRSKQPQRRLRARAVERKFPIRDGVTCGCNCGNPAARFQPMVSSVKQRMLSTRAENCCLGHRPSFGAPARADQVLGTGALGEATRGLPHLRPARQPLKAGANNPPARRVTDAKMEPRTGSAVRRGLPQRPCGIPGAVKSRIDTGSYCTDALTGTHGCWLSARRAR